MIQLLVNTHDYENDVRVMTQAFYPEVKIATCLVDILPEETEETLSNAGTPERDNSEGDAIAGVWNRLKNLAGTGEISPLPEVNHICLVRVVGGNITIRLFLKQSELPTSEGSANALTGGNAFSVLNMEDADWVCLAVDEREEAEDNKRIRNHLKRSLYGIYSTLTGKELPWGTLTGIRPCKIPTKMLEEGRTDAEITDHLEREYLASPGKAALSLSVAHTETRLLSSLDYEKGYSLYIGIPFCPTTCLYCSFTSYPIGAWRNRTDSYVEALCKELEFLGRLLAGRKADTIYMGGGTPTTLLPHQFEKIFTRIEKSFDLGGLHEFTVEAGRPDSIDADKLQVIKEHGIGRISINPQTMNQKTLDLIGRRHTVEDIEKAYTLARGLGFDDINMDLIVGLPGEDIRDVEYTLQRVKELNPDNLTVHSLAIKRAARLNTMKEQYADYRIENTDEMIALTQEYALAMGMNPYYLYRQKNMAGNFENVGYARPGKEGIYNILIMEEKQSIYAAGANAQSKIVFNHGERVERIENVKDVANYIDRVDEMILRKKQFFECQ